ncbi:MAG TPA: PilN domain-containing protein [Burkholderiales bacterium]|nr:PilN domain-containing protein [Burkholderiales bacterium]
MMQKIQLNFAGRSRRSPWAGALLFAVALAVAGDAAWSYVHAQRTLAQAERLLARAQPRHAPRAAVAPEELAAARDTVQRLALPWPRLFAALESAASDDVSLTAVEPDPRGGKVTVSGNGKNYLAALTYVLNLSRSDALTHVELVRHDERPGGGHAVAFSVSAAWKEAK